MSSLPPLGASTPQQPGTTQASSSAVNPYVQELDNLEVADNEELMQVAFGSPQSATTNLLDVLAQAAQLQAENYQTQSTNTIDTQA